MCNAEAIAVLASAIPKVSHTPWGVYDGCSSSFLRPWARRWINHWSLWHTDSVMPFTFPDAGHNCPVTSTKLYTAWWRRHMCANNLPRVVTWKQNCWGLNPWPLELCVQCHDHYTRPNQKQRVLSLSPRPLHAPFWECKDCDQPTENKLPLWVYLSADG